MKRLIILLFLFTSIFCPGVIFSQANLVKTAEGYIKGYQDNNAIVFKGIPYAAPATGKQRFKAPLPHKKWLDTLNCSHFGSIAAQPGNNNQTLAGSEDGLFLNVYTPVINKKAKLPVLVWIHGGGMVGGSSNSANGHAFADHDSIVTVTINYRLGVFGFLYLGDLGKDYNTSGNNGLLDCIAALKWIQRNIAKFGGDPSKVTVMGESAGAKLSSSLAITESAKGLFSGLILESGALQCVRDLNTAKSIRSRLMRLLKVNSPKEILKFSTKQLIEAEAAVLGGAQGTNYFGPVIDDVVIKQSPYQYIDKNKSSRIRYLVGTNQEESRLFMDMDKRLYHPDSSQVLKDWFGDNSIYVSEAINKKITNRGYDTLSIMSVLSEYMYKMHTYRLANHISAKDKVWVYQFTYSENKKPATHGAEMRYVWFLPQIEKYNKIELSLAEQIHGAWVHFIRFGTPGLINGIPWNSYNIDYKNVMNFNGDSESIIIKNPYNDNTAPSSCFLLK